MSFLPQSQAGIAVRLILVASVSIHRNPFPTAFFPYGVTILPYCSTPGFRALSTALYLGRHALRPSAPVCRGQNAGESRYTVCTGWIVPLMLHGMRRLHSRCSPQCMPVDSSFQGGQLIHLSVLPPGARIYSHLNARPHRPRTSSSRKDLKGGCMD